MASKTLMEQARHRARNGGIVLTELPGMLGPMVFTPLGVCGNVDDGISVDSTHSWQGQLSISGGVMSRRDARRLHKWLSTQIGKWDAEKPRPSRRKGPATKAGGRGKR